MSFNKKMLAILVIVSSFISLTNAKLFPIAVRLPLNGTPPDNGASLWPHPVSLDVRPESFFIDKEKFSMLSANLNRCEREIIDSLWSHYQNVFFPPKISYSRPYSADTKLNTVVFTISTANSIGNGVVCSNEYYPLFEDTETESYELVVESGQARLQAKSVWGLVRALESFSQLTYYFPDHRLAVNRTRITDRPRFLHRGVMLDSSRHYLPIPLIKKHLDTMMYTKMNVFHWHLSDDQSFPFESDTYPDLYKKGAFSQDHTYSKKNIAELIEFARIRGIRIIPEFDTPGHTYSWGLGYPGLITECWSDGKPLQAIYNFHGAREILNPIQNYTYDFLNGLISEVKATFRDPYVHLGMDEVYYRCWESNPDIREWMEKQGYTQINQVEEYYMARVLSMTQDIGYKSIVWQDVWDNNVPVFRDTILQVWKNNDSQTETQWQYYLSRTTEDGYKTILSSPWYLNYIEYGNDWYKFYKVEPYNFTGTDEQKKLIIGGEACIWGEYVDGANSISRFWPRAGAVAERLWSESKWDDVEEAKFRLEDHRCRLLRRGIEAGPVFNSFCGDYDVYMPNNVINHPVFNYENTNINSGVLSNFLVKTNFIVLSTVSAVLYNCLIN